MKGSAMSLKEELGTDLLSQLSAEDQTEMDLLTDQIKSLTQQNKDSLKERIKVN